MHTLFLQQLTHTTWLDGLHYELHHESFGLAIEYHAQHFGLVPGFNEQHYQLYAGVREHVPLHPGP
jgi:hypothetical protein